jgi:hypothetical protein
MNEAELEKEEKCSERLIDITYLICIVTSPKSILPAAESAPWPRGGRYP